jgi:hypothetical protein
MVGVLVGWLATLILVLYATPSLVSYFGEIPILPRTAGGILGFFGIMLAAEIFVGLALALLGSLLAVSRVRPGR